MLIKRQKIFCIGLNKTGTTTIEKVLTDFNYKLGNQTKGELLISDWYKRDFRAILKLCKTADAFQDIPFSLPYTFILLDQHFPNAKFILTIRDTPEQWYNSIVKFHSKRWSDGIKAPNIEELKNAKYLYRGAPFDFNRMMFNTIESDPYNKEILLEYYNNHNYQVIEYFRSKPEKLIIVNVSIKADYKRLCQFLNKSPKYDTFPWKNKTNN